MLKIINGDITKQKDNVDIICNASNGLGCMVAGVSRSIGKEAGICIQLESFMRALSALHLAGTIYVTSAGNLNCKKIVHLTTMFLPGTWSTSRTIRKCLLNLIQYCITHNYKTVLLPFIAVGTGMVNHNKAIKVYFDILNNSDILFIVCDKDAKLIEEFKNYFKLNS